MGIDARIVAYAPDEATAAIACDAAFRRIAELEDVMSDYRPRSEVMRLCDRAGQGPVPVSADLMKVLRQAENVSRASFGAFDVTVGPLVKLWRQARRDGKMPPAEELKRARALVGWRRVKLDPKAGTVELTTPGVRIDLGGIGKGFACDEALKALKANGVHRALIEMGGDIVLGGAPPGQRGWKIYVANAAGVGQGEEMFLSDCALSTSGDTEQYVVIDGVRYSHVINPKTGLGLSSRTQASVIARRGLTSDPVSKVLTVMAPQQREWFLCRHPELRAFTRTEFGR